MTSDAAAKAQVPEPVEAALRRLISALDRLEAANERRTKAQAVRANLEEELAVMQDDRARLAVELDGAIAKVKALDLANEETARRLSHACAEIRAVLAAAAAREG
jgi:chromosome segregation ATPase